MSSTRTNSSTTRKTLAREAQTDAAAPPTATVDVTQETLEATPARLLTFLRGVGTRPAIRAALAAVGYDVNEHQRGWSLLHACSGFEAAPVAPEVDREVVNAINTLDGQDERVNALIDASLVHRAPSAREGLLHGLSPGKGGEAVLYFRVLLDRMGKLESGTLAQVSRADARKAVEVLAKRGLGEDWQRATAALVKKAEGYASPASAADSAARQGEGEGGAEGDDADAAQRALVDARMFYQEWSRIAHAELKRKDYLIVLGLASRKSPKKKSAAKADAGSDAQG